MKQLLDSCSLQGHVIVGVGTHVFVLLNQTTKNKTSNSNVNTSCDVCTPIELLIAQPKQVKFLWDLTNIKINNSIL